MHQHSIERVETFVGAMLDVLTGQLQTLRTRVQIGPETLSDPASAPSAAFLKVTQDWTDPYRRLLGAAPASFRRDGDG
jgi:hypothetical protein